VTGRSHDGIETSIGSLHLRPPTLVSESDSLEKVASMLVADTVSCAVLVEPPLRLVTEFDLTRGLAQGRRPEDPVATVASEHPRWAPPSANVAEGAALMVSLGVRHLVVLDPANGPRGVVSMTELFDLLVRSQDPMAMYARFADIMLHGGDSPPGFDVGGGVDQPA
jgi:signal-transduction protein with cAMP-binding, CBS, and nucleotidyltransferase domain